MNNEVKALKSELALLKLQFSERVNAVEQRLNNLLTSENIASDQHKTSLVETEETSTPAQNLKVAGVDFSPSTTNKPNTSRYSPTKLASEPKIKAKPSIIFIFFQTLLHSLYDWFSPVSKIYQSYKDKGMLGIFILTIVGIGLTLAGFGYLMQLLIDQLGAGSKSLLMCFAAFSVIGLGITLKIKTRFGEYATAIVTLGILLSYSTVYFAGSVYGILPNIAVLILYLLIALLCHGLALWLDTKVVAALGVVGIATMPIISNTINSEPLYYLLSLAFVVASSLILAYRYVGNWLAQLSLVFTLVSLEWIIGFESIALSSWIINVFYLLFFSYVVMSLRAEEKSTNKTLIYLAAIVGSTMLVFFQAVDGFSNQISFYMVFNTSIAIAAGLFFFKAKRELTPIFILVAATWAVLAVVTSLSNAYWGIAWSVEGLLLLFISRKYHINSAVNQGQILTAIALVYSWAALAAYFPLPALKSINGWVLSITIAVVIAIWQRLINSKDVFNHLAQHKIKPLLQLLEVIWLTVLAIAASYIWLGYWTGPIIILIQLVLLFRAKYCKQVAIEIFAAILILVPLFYVYQGIILVDSFRFTLLPLFAKLSLISAFIQLWLWSAFYRKYHPNSAIKHIAEFARILFYMLIPICWVASVVRRFDENSLMFLWLSPLLALLLVSRVNHHLLIKETKILTVLASVCFALIISQLTLVNGLISCFGFSSLYAVAYFLNRRNTQSTYQFVCSWGVISLGFAIPIFIGFQTDTLAYGIIAGALYWVMSFKAIALSEHHKRNELFIIIANLIFVVVSWLLIESNVIYALIPTVFLVVTIYKKETNFAQTKLSNLCKPNSDLFLHSILAITYTVLLFSLDEYRLNLLVAPALAIHGALILFIKDRRTTTVKYSFILMLLGILKLATIDAASALLWQKVILFIGIGIFMLVASFWYQKTMIKNEH